MQKKITVWSAAMICIFAVVISVMGTVLVYRTSFNRELNALNEQYNAAAEELDRVYQAKIDAVNEQIAEYGDIAADLREIDEMYRANFPGVLDASSLRDFAIKGYVAGTGDRYGFYYSPEEAEELMNEVNGESDGIGVNVIYDADVGCIEIVSVTPDSPAEKNGVMAGDYIAYVFDKDGKRAAVAEIGYEVALNLLKGKSGTEAKFVVLRDDNGDEKYEEIEFSIERAHIESVSVMYHVYELDKTVGVIKITGFDKKTPEQFIDAVEALKQDGVTKLVFDVRNNPGGDKDAVCEVLDYLLPEGVLMRTVDADGNYTVIETSDASFLDMPMAVIMNSGTASAGELFAAAIKDYGAGLLVGETTYGKGSMQSIVPVFDDGSLLRLTVALYCPPVSENYDGIGIAPDIEEPLDEALENKNPFKYTDAEDNQLSAAVATFK